MDKTEETAEIIVDFMNAVEAAAVSAKMQIGKLYTSVQEDETKETVGVTWNPEKIAWAQAEGSSGPYERSEDAGNADFKAMIKDLEDHGGKLTKEGKFYWLFMDKKTVGRKVVQWKK